jgi:hypothetical protein
MEQVTARAALVSAPDVGDGLTTTITRSEIEEVLAAEEEPIELMLDVARSSNGEATESRSVAVAWERSDLERLLSEAQDENIVLTFDRDTLQQATEGDVEAHGLRETAIVLAVSATAAAGFAGTAAAVPDPGGTGPVAIQQSVSPDDRAFSRMEAPQLSPDDRAVARSPVDTPTPGVTPDDRALPRTEPPSLSPDDRAVPRSTPVSAPDTGVTPDDRAFPRVEPPQLSPDDRAVPRGGPVSAPATGTASDPGTWSAPSPETLAVAGAIALAIAGAFFVVGTDRRRVRPI